MIEIRNLNSYAIDVKTYGADAIQAVDSDGSMAQIPNIEIVVLHPHGGVILEGDVRMVKIYKHSDEAYSPPVTPVGGD